MALSLSLEREREREDIGDRLDECGLLALVSDLNMAENHCRSYAQAVRLIHGLVCHFDPLALSLLGDKKRGLRL